MSATAVDPAVWIILVIIVAAMLYLEYDILDTLHEKKLKKAEADAEARGREQTMNEIRSKIEEIELELGNDLRGKNPYGTRDAIRTLAEKLGMFRLTHGLVQVWRMAFIGSMQHLLNERLRKAEQTESIYGYFEQEEECYDFVERHRSELGADLAGALLSQIHSVGVFKRKEAFVAALEKLESVLETGGYVDKETLEIFALLKNFAEFDGEIENRIEKLVAAHPEVFRELT